MALNCSLIKPQTFEFNAQGCDSKQINLKCPHNGQSRMVFDIEMPNSANSALVNINIKNLRTNQNISHIMTISEYECSCSTLCIEDTGYKKNNTYMVSVLLNGLIPGDRYLGSACLEYIP